MKTSLVLLVALVTLATPLLAQTATEPKAPESKTESGAKPKNVTPEETEKLIKTTPKPLILDVRTAEEFAAGHIEGATNLDINDAEFSKKLAALDQSQPLIVHCAAGGRSTRALKQIDTKKFPAVYHMNGGFNAWKEAGKPVAK